MFADTLGSEGASEKGDDNKCTHVCPKPCNQTVYEPALSYALLSSMSVDQILTEDSTELQRKYDSALETRQRTDGDIFTRDLQMLNNLIRYYEDIVRLVREYLRSDSATFPHLLEAVQTFETDIFLSDIKSLLGTIPEFDLVYRNIYEDKKNLLFNYSTVMNNNLNEIEQLLYLTIRGNSVHKYLGTVTDTALMHETLQRETLNLLREELLNTTLAVRNAPSQISFLPSHFFLDPHACDNKMITFNTTLNDIQAILEDIQAHANRQSQQHVNQLKHLHPDFLRIVEAYNSHSSSARVCFNEYPLLLEQTLAWKDESSVLVREASVRIESQDYDIDSALEKVMTDFDRVEKAENLYTDSLITKLKLLQMILNEDSQDRPSTSISTFKARVKNWISDPVRAELLRAQTDMRNSYTKAMHLAANLSTYLVDYYFYTRAEMMQLWRNPIPNIESPDKYDDEGIELWRIWDRNTPITEFVDYYSHEHINTAIAGYFHPLFAIVDTFEEQLDGMEKNLIAALEEVVQQYGDYKDERRIEHNFVA